MRFFAKGTYCWKTNGEIGLKTPQFMKHKCVFAKGTYFMKQSNRTFYIGMTIFMLSFESTSGERIVAGTNAGFLPF
jgi:hypothetical protein